MESVLIVLSSTLPYFRERHDLFAAPLIYTYEYYTIFCIDTKIYLD
ncbi:hypothetical protein [Pseudanabaena sp. UWO311]